jgi:hypothetical protein
MLRTAQGSWRLARWLGLALVLAAPGCDKVPFSSSGGPAPPRHFDAYYYDRAVYLSWELDPRWDGEAFRIWGKRKSDADYFLVAEVTNCADGFCSYTDSNVVPEVTYVYYVSAVDASGNEAASDEAIEVFVPQPVPPPVPGNLDAVPLDGAIYLRWGTNSRQAQDFAFYRVYLEGGDGSTVLLGETDSEGFLDLLVQNGSTYGYFISAVDEDGHESQGSALAEGTPRPDFHGELLYAYQDRPEASGLRFQDSEETDPVLSGDDPTRHLTLEYHNDAWWLAPGPGVEVSDEVTFTTALRCGPASDGGCVDVRYAPDSGYSSAPVPLLAEYAYVLRVPAGGGDWRYALIRVSHLGFAQDGAIAIFDWAFQLQPGNPSLAPR